MLSGTRVRARVKAGQRWASDDGFKAWAHLNALQHVAELADALVAQGHHLLAQRSEAACKYCLQWNHAEEDGEAKECRDADLRVVRQSLNTDFEPVQALDTTGMG